jgi:hypothetical protein
LRTVEGERTEEESDEQATGITQEDGRRIEVIAQKSKDGAGERDGHHFHERRTMQERDDEDNHGREKS